MVANGAKKSAHVLTMTGHHHRKTAVTLASNGSHLSNTALKQEVRDLDAKLPAKYGQTKTMLAYGRRTVAAKSDALLANKAVGGRIDASASPTKPGADS